MATAGTVLLAGRSFRTISSGIYQMHLTRAHSNYHFLYYGRIKCRGQAKGRSAILL